LSRLAGDELTDVVDYEIGFDHAGPAWKVKLPPVLESSVPLYVAEAPYRPLAMAALVSTLE
jgi:hypothetical protein